MTTESLSIFKALTAKMDYINQKQRVISQNISNADTPGYKANELQEVDFSDVLKKVTKSNDVYVNRTASRHITPNGNIDDPRERDARKVYDVNPSENAVDIEEQLVSAQSNMMDYNMMTNLYQKNVSMIRMALGNGQ
ncbi:MAG: flagellar basal body rod protein FlgB [Micavibrio sp.]|nr:flagellar basal body rod protein FlgB [Micavibrio sp.]|tara:strand:- start:251 stop:661 length:411 start_codon:yes stop_codon:yes gene_type:complete